jgi:hypothetical protein
MTPAILSETPVECRPPLSTKMPATTIAGSLEKPLSASLASSRPLTVRPITSNSATRSVLSHSVMSSTNAARRIAKNAV